MLLLLFLLSLRVFCLFAPLFFREENAQFTWYARHLKAQSTSESVDVDDDEEKKEKWSFACYESTVQCLVYRIYGSRQGRCEKYALKCTRISFLAFLFLFLPARHNKMWVWTFFPDPMRSIVYTEQAMNDDDYSRDMLDIFIFTGTLPAKQNYSSNENELSSIIFFDFSSPHIFESSSLCLLSHRRHNLQHTRHTSGCFELERKAKEKLHITLTKEKTHDDVWGVRWEVEFLELKLDSAIFCNKISLSSRVLLSWFIVVMCAIWHHLAVDWEARKMLKESDDDDDEKFSWSSSSMLSEVYVFQFEENLLRLLCVCTRTGVSLMISKASTQFDAAIKSNTLLNSTVRSKANEQNFHMQITWLIMRNWADAT